MSTLSDGMDTLLEGGGLSNAGTGRAVTGVEGTEATNGEASKLPVAEFGVGIEMVFGVMVSPLVSVSASLLSTSSTIEPLSVVRLSAGLSALSFLFLLNNDTSLSSSFSSSTWLLFRPLLGVSGFDNFFLFLSPGEDALLAGDLHVFLSISLSGVSVPLPRLGRLRAFCSLALVRVLILPGDSSWESI